MDGTHLLGLLNVYHDRPHHWTPDELDTIGALATQASVAIQAAQDFERMATWAAQLQSIQQLGTRLNRLSSVAEIGQSIATELRQLIDYHNARVYRLVGDDLVPVAMQGQVGEYVDETPDQLRVARRRGHHRLGRRPPGRPDPRRCRGRSAGRHHPGDARTTSTNRCSSRRWCSTTRSSASSSCRSSGSTSSPTTTCGCSSSTPASRPRRWPTPTRPSGCASRRSRSSSSCAASASSSRSPNRS